MQITKCKICSAETKQKFIARILHKYDVQYYECPNCGFVQTEKPYWLEEAYKNSMNLSDTGIVLRNQRLARISTSIIFIFFDRRESFVDYAGGYGLFTRIMRDIGFDFCWSDPFTQNILARGFEAEKGKKYSLATSFESFEHFENPTFELGQILAVADNIIISTEPIPSPIPAIKEWWYYAPEHGQHISFYTAKSFSTLAKLYNLHYYNVDNIHLMFKTKLSLVARLLLKLPSSKYLLYALSYLIQPILKSRTLEDMNLLKNK